MAADFSTLFEFLPIGAYRTRPDGSLSHVNPALVRLNGYTTEAEFQQAVNDIGIEWYAEPGRRAEFRRQLEAAGQVVGFQSEVLRHKSRERIWITENAHVVRGADGALLYYEGTIEEITDRVHARDALRASREQLRQIVELVPGMVYRVVILPGGERRATFVSGGVRELLELEPADILNEGKLMHRLRHPDDRARVEAVTGEAARSGRPMQLEYRVQLASGREKWVHVFSAPAPPEDGNDVRVGMVFDITARKQAEQALLDNSERWKRALESSGDGVWDWHVEQGEESISPQLKALYGYAEHELADNPAVLDAMTHPEDLPAMLRARADHLAGRTPSYVNEHRMRCKNGQWKWILTRGTVISRGPGGEPLRIIGTHTDITADKQAVALRIERDRAAAADLAKSQFLSRVSHELRTPLNAILGFAQLLEIDPGDGVRQRDWVRQVLASGRHLLSLMDDILDLSSAQTGQLPFVTEPVALRPVVEEALAMVSGMAQDAGVQVIDEVPPGDTLLAQADRKRLKQVVSNLLSNAIKYNQRGGWVRVTASAVASNAAVELVVADNGPGMDAEQLARLFQPFERVGAQRGTVPGTGLGLALSRQLVEAMGGSITVASTPGGGSRFCVRLLLG